MAGAWTKKEKADFSKGATSGGSLLPESKPDPKPEPGMGVMQDIEDGVAAQQKSNLADPAVADRLAKVAAQRRKFYGQ